MIKNKPDINQKLGTYNKKDLDKEFEYLDVEEWENSDSNERYDIWKLRRDFDTKISIMVILMVIGFIFIISRLPHP